MSIIDGDSPLKTPLQRFIIQIIFVVGLSRILRYICRKVKQPTVVAEMVAGILLGPSVFGRIPGFSDAFFPPESHDTLNVMANVGLIFFLFLVGLQLDITIVKENIRSSIGIATLGVIIPFVCSIPVSWLLHTQEYALDSTYGNFMLFMGIAMGISALPVLARIVAERRMLEDRVGVLVMSASAIDDFEGWLLLAVVVSSTKMAVLYTALLCLGTLPILFVVNYIMTKINSHVEDHRAVTQFHLFTIFLILFAFSWLTDIIGISAIFGAFEVGCIMPRNSILIHELTEKLEDLVIVVFMPLFFTYSGLRTEFGYLNDGETWAYFLLIFSVAFFSKMIGCAAVAKWIKNLKTKECISYGVLMQTKGLVALFVFNVGLQYNVISSKLFAINVLMVLLSTILTTPLVNHISPMTQHRGPNNLNSAFSILVFSSQPVVGSSLVSVAQSFVQAFGKFNYKVVCFALIKDKDKLSAYMNKVLSKTIQKRNPNLNAYLQRAKSIGVKVESMVYMKRNQGKDICNAALECNAQLILLGSDNFSFNKRILHVFENSEADVGVLIGREVEGKISKVLVLIPSWRANDQVNILLDYVRKIVKPANTNSPSPTTNTTITTTSYSATITTTTTIPNPTIVTIITTFPTSPSSLHTTIPISSTTTTTNNSTTTITVMLTGRPNAALESQITKSCKDSMEFVKSENELPPIDEIAKGDYSLVILLSPLSYSHDFDNCIDKSKEPVLILDNDFNQSINTINSNSNSTSLLFMHIKTDIERERMKSTSNKGKASASGPLTSVEK